MSKESVWILSSENDDHWAFYDRDKAISYAQDMIMRLYPAEISIDEWRNFFTLVEVTLHV